MHANPDLVHACFAYLDAKSLLACETVSREWHAAAQDPFVWEMIYCMQWRRGAKLPREADCKKLTVKDWKQIYRQRKSIPLDMHARGEYIVQADETLLVVLPKLRFLDRWVEGVCTQAAVRPLAFSRMVLHWEVCYFEARFLGCGSVGFVPRNGGSWGGISSRESWPFNSYSYHSDDGTVFWKRYEHGAEGQWEAYGPSWGKTEATPAGTEPDTIGCGIDLFNCELFFTKNGEFLGFAPVRTEIGVDYVAAVMLNNDKDAVEINVGRKAFVFDLEGFLATGPPVVVEKDDD